MEDIFILSNCDEWKSYASAKIKMATTDICMMYAAIFAEIKNDNMNYKSDNIDDSIALFLEDMETGDVEFSNLKYGMVNIMDNVLVENLSTQYYVENLEKYHNELFCVEHNSEADEHENIDDFER